MNPVTVSFTIDTFFLTYLLLALVLLAWACMPVLLDIPKKFKVKDAKTPKHRLVLAVALTLPWVLIAACVSILATIFLKVSDLLFNLVIKMKAKIW